MGFYLLRFICQFRNDCCITGRSGSTVNISSHNTGQGNELYEFGDKVPILSFILTT